MKIFSGIQPSGTLHIGNYLGAVKNWVAMQKEHECIFCIVDLHALTVPYDTKQISQNIFELAVDLLASGLDPGRCILFVQSHVKEHSELAWILSTITPLSELERMTQYKEKAQQHKEGVNAGLLNYPILMAADILLYQTEGVPVGEDQKQHVELARTIARKFNNTFGQSLTLPRPLIKTEGARIMSLTDPSKKMSKSLGADSYIALADSLEEIERKLAKAVTDPARKKITDRGHPAKCNIFSLHQLFSPTGHSRAGGNPVDQIANQCRNAKIGCLDCKKLLARAIAKEFIIFRKKRQALLKQPEKVKQILSDSADRARSQAQEMMTAIKKKMGLQ